MHDRSEMRQHEHGDDRKDSGSSESEECKSEEEEHMLSSSLPALSDYGYGHALSTEDVKPKYEMLDDKSKLRATSQKSASPAVIQWYEPLLMSPFLFLSHT